MSALFDPVHHRHCATRFWSLNKCDCGLAQGKTPTKPAHFAEMDAIVEALHDKNEREQAELEHAEWEQGDG